MRTNRERLLYKLPTVAACLCGIARIHSDDLMTSPFSLVRENVEELPPSSIHDGLRKMMVLHHVGDLKVFYRDMEIGLCIPFGDFELVIAPLPIDLEMRLCRTLGGFPVSVTAFLAPAHQTLFASERALALAVMAWVLNRLPFRVGEKRFESNINADIRMGTGTCCMFCLWLCFADEQRIPMPVSTQDKMSGFGSTFDGAVQFDLERTAQLLGDKQVLPVCVQQHIPAVLLVSILPQLDGVPSIRFLETWEPDTRDMILLGSQETLERLTETVREHLYRSFGYILPSTPFELLIQVVFGRKRSILLILCLDGLKHLIVNETGLSQALHELSMLCFIHEKPILKCSHASNYIY